MAAPPLERRAKPAFERARKRGIYLLPNLFTTLALFAGFYAIVQGMNHNFEQAAIGDKVYAGTSVLAWLKPPTTT